MTNDKDRKAPLSLSSKGTMGSRTSVETGQVRQSFSHGRSKVVQVEVRRRKRPTGSGDPSPATAPAPPPSFHQTEGTLTDAEIDARRRALDEAARHAAEEEARRAEEEKKRIEREQEEARLRAEEEARAAEAAARTAAESAAAAAAEQPQAPVSPDVAPEQVVHIPDATRVPPPPPVLRTARVDEEDEVRAKKVPGRGAVPAKPAPSTKRNEPKRRGKLTISAALSGEEQAERARSMAAVRRAKQKEKRKLEGDQPAERVVREVTIPDTITVQELANRMAERSTNVIKSLMKMGVMATINQTIDADTAELVVSEFGHTANRVSDADVELGLIDREPDPESELVGRPPVVTVMGHVDHGKTSLLDALRSTNVVSGEAGGITQHIGAYQVTSPSGHKITFIDTPGHAAFTAMRARGASVTDIVVLVVAANDGIMPQTIEAIRHAKAANVPVVVAINKIDLPDANPTKIMQDLLQHELVVENLGGDVQTVEVSAKQRINLEGLEEALVLQAEILDLKANPNRSAHGVVIEAKMEKGRGSVATILVQQGTLRVGDIFVAGSEWGRVRALVDEHGKRIHEAPPAMPVEVLGFQGTPAAGDDFIVVADENRAREVSEYRFRKEREAQQVRSARSTMEQMFEKIQTGEARELPVVIKADVQGSVEALSATLERLGNDDVKVRVLHAAVGGINESDVTLAKASGAIVLGFNVRANPLAREMARRDGIEIRYHSIIYAAADEIKALLSGLLEPTYQERFIGYAAIREVFSVSKVGKVAGCMVTEGVVKRGAKVRLLRDDVVIHEGNLGQLKRFKDDVREVREGYECGISLENYNDIQVGDVIECFEMEQIETSL